MNRRDWIVKSGAASALTLFGGSTLASTLSLEEKINFNPRVLTNPVQLNYNENPFGPSASARKAMTEAFDIGCRYPSSYMRELVDMIAKKEGVTKDHIVVAGGSTEGLKITGLTFANNGGEIIAAQPTFLAMMTYAEQWGATINWVPLDKTMTHDIAEMERRITAKTKLVFLCNPNNPTSTLLDRNKLIDFCTSASKKTIVFSDEAYYDFIEEKDYPSMVSLVKKDENVIVSRTFSKVYGLAGLRIGYLVAKPSIASKLKENIVAFTNVLAIRAAMTAMKDQEFYDFSVKKVTEGKKMMYQTMDDLGLSYVPSHTNFIFFKTGKNIETFYKEMLEQGVLVGRAFPPYTDWCRISMGTIEEVQVFNQALRKVIG
jgi:histidinol-phosphate aminotransferase